MNERQQKELGRTLRLVRHMRQMTLRDVARRSGRSYQYVQNIETGARGAVVASDEAFAEWIATGYSLPLPMVQGMILRAEVSSALESYGLSLADVDFGWAGIDGRLRELGKAEPPTAAQVAEEAMRR